MGCFANTKTYNCWVRHSPNEPWLKQNFAINWRQIRPIRPAMVVYWTLVMPLSKSCAATPQLKFIPKELFTVPVASSKECAYLQCGGEESGFQLIACLQMRKVNISRMYSIVCLQLKMSCCCLNCWSVILPNFQLNTWHLMPYARPFMHKRITPNSAPRCWSQVNLANLSKSAPYSVRISWPTSTSLHPTRPYNWLTVCSSTTATKWPQVWKKPGGKLCKKVMN